VGEAVRVAVAILTYNRFDFLTRTLASLRRSGHPFALHLLDGGSTDPLQREFVLANGGRLAQIASVGESVNVAVGWALESKPDLVLFTADDYEYHPGWLASLVRFWEAAPPDVAIVSCNLEPEYDWNTVTDVIDAGGMRALVRNSVPGSNWSFRTAMWPQIGPLEAKTGGEDLEVCRHLRAAGYRLAALDLCKHIGEGAGLSAWGNESWRDACPLDRQKWGI
jgi:glycosyltransferase involved in cell wall biosynthesis